MARFPSDHALAGILAFGILIRTPPEAQETSAKEAAGRMNLDELGTALRASHALLEAVEKELGERKC